MSTPTKANLNHGSRFGLAFALLTLLLIWPSQTARADEIAIWNFNDSNLIVDHGAGTLVTSFTSIGFAAGTTTNARLGDPAGLALNLTNQINNGQNITLSVSTVGFSNVMVSFATQGSGTGFNSNQFQYSLDGVTFVNFGAPYDPPLAFGPSPVVFDLSSITGLNNNASAAFRIVFNGASSATGTNRIDNLVVEGTPVTTPIPEPASILLLGLGLISTIAMRRQRH